jgi:hypothetical protein
MIAQRLPVDGSPFTNRQDFLWISPSCIYTLQEKNGDIAAGTTHKSVVANGHLSKER